MGESNKQNKNLHLLSKWKSLKQSKYLSKARSSSRCLSPEAKLKCHCKIKLLCQQVGTSCRAPPKYLPSPRSLCIRDISGHLTATQTEETKPSESSTLRRNNGPNRVPQAQPRPQWMSWESHTDCSLQDTAAVRGPSLGKRVASQFLTFQEK